MIVRSIINKKKKNILECQFKIIKKNDEVVSIKLLDIKELVNTEEKIKVIKELNMDMKSLTHSLKWLEDDWSLFLGFKFLAFSNKIVQKAIIDVIHGKECGDTMRAFINIILYVLKEVKSEPR